MLLDGDRLSYTLLMALGVVGVAQVLPGAREAFRTGEGVPYDAYGADARHLIARGNRPMFVNPKAVVTGIDPVAALRAMASMRSEGATVLVADERVADEFTTDVEFGEGFQWGGAPSTAPPCARSEPLAAGTGSIMRMPTFRAYGRKAGFAEVEVLPIENDSWRFCRLS